MSFIIFSFSFSLLPPTPFAWWGNINFSNMLARGKVTFHDVLDHGALCQPVKTGGTWLYCHFLYLSCHLMSVSTASLSLCVPGEYGTVAGWGRLSEGGVLPSILQYVSTLSSCHIVTLSPQTTVPIVSNEKCKNMFLAAGRHEVRVVCM